MIALHCRYLAEEPHCATNALVDMSVKGTSPTPKKNLIGDHNKKETRKTRKESKDR